jgi:hypothetical protein
MTMIGNGCLEEYPIVHTNFPAKSCWDSNSGGFGDAWSGQNTNLDSFTCDHCFIAYNAKDGALGPHTVTHNIVLTNSVWAANMGQAGKWGQDTGSNFLFQNNLVLGNCMRMSQAVSGASQNFSATGASSATITGGNLITITTSPNVFVAGQHIYMWGFPGSLSFLNGTTLTVLSSGLTSTQFQANYTGTNGTYTDNGMASMPGAYLTNFCRAAGPLFDYFAGPGSTVNFTGNTWVTYQPTIFEPGCSPVGTCGSTAYNFTNNLVLGYTSTYTNSPFTTGQSPTLFAFDDSPLSIQWSHNLTFGIRPGDYTPNCATNGNVCANPLLTGQPSAAIPPESTLDGFANVAGTNWYPSGSSPVIGAGVAVGGLTTDYYGASRPNPPGIGAVESAGTPTVAAPTPSPAAGTYVGTQSVTWSTATGGASIVYTNDGTTPTVTALTCTITNGTPYTGAISVPSSITLKAIGCLSGDNASSLTTAAYTITTPTVADPTFSPVAGTYVGTQSVTISTVTSGATICWTNDGSTPAASTPGTCSHGTTYSGPISVPASITLKALATKSGDVNSGVVTSAYVITAPATPKVTISGTATISGGATIQ